MLTYVLDKTIDKLLHPFYHPSNPIEQNFIWLLEIGQQNI